MESQTLREDEPWLHEMSDGTEYAKQDKKTSGCDVGPTQERVLPTHPRYCRDDDTLRALVRSDREVCNQKSASQS